MNGILKLSLGLNVILSVVVLGVVCRRFAAPDRPVPLSSAVSPVHDDIPAPFQNERPESSAMSGGQFNWSRIESTDYRVYVANLRGIGCPEQTIRDIITADLDALVFAPRRRQWELNAASQLSSPVAGVLARADVENQIRQLNGEEAELITRLLATAVSAASPAARRADRGHPRPPAMPLAMQNVDAGPLRLNARQLEIIEDIRRQFETQMSGPPQDPSDPAYREKWLAAQRDADEMLKGMLGDEFVLHWEEQAAGQN